jgi:4-amino-4-deoxy-L-arabinose transferase-like glycosyltransferase
MNNLFETKMRANLTIISGFIALSMIMRFFSFFPTLTSHDEGTFFVIARELFQGKIYFADLVDTKPIGIFLILGLFIRYCSTSIFMIRLFTALIIAVTAYTIYKISLHDQKEQKPAIAAGAIFIFMLSIFTYFGVFINPELFYTLFTALGFYIFIRTNKPGGFLLTGFLLGIGFILKYVVLFDLAAWLFYYFVTALLKKEWKTTRKVFVNCALSCLGFLTPFAIVALYYYRVGHLKEFWFYTFGVTSRFPVERTFLQTLIYVGDFHLRFLPVLFFFYYALIKVKNDSRGPVIANGLIITWCLMVLLAVIIPGKPFGHYFIQMMLPVSIVAGRFFREKLVQPKWMNKLISYPAGTIILAVIISGNVLMQKHDYFDKPDVPKQVAEYLKPKLKAEDRIYTGNYQQVLYYLLEKDCPVKYVHRTLMCNPEHRNMLQIDLPAEMNALMAMNFRYILMQGPFCYEPMNLYIREYYLKIKEFPGDVMVYERK